MTDVIEQLIIRPQASRVREASSWLRERCRELGAQAEQTDRLELCFNEAIANVMAHGGDAAQENDLSLRVQLLQQGRANELQVVMIDSGLPFDPISARVNERPTRLADAEPGGLGLLLLRSLSDRLSYQRIDDRNELKFSVVWNSQE